MKKFMPFLIIVILVILFTSCDSNEISLLKAQKQDLENASKENLSRIKQLEDNINEKDIEINRLRSELSKENITFDDQKQVEQLIKEYFTDLEKRDYSSAWELTSLEQQKTYSKENAIKEHWGLESIKYISLKAYFPTKTSSTGEVPPNTPTVWFCAIFNVEPSLNTAWTKGSNSRYVNVIKEIDGKWRIGGLATGP